MFGEIVRVEVRDRDPYGRLAGDVFTWGGESLNAEPVRAGFAWWYRRYAPKDTKLAALEAEARAAKRGRRVDLPLTIEDNPLQAVVESGALQPAPAPAR